ncbi:MAG TPA: methyltransferase [Edaphocola sp.]|nr:methyltransferase [Edaphocola sp.]
MANSYFQFKQFRIHQEDVGMKVSTDACIQGALAADKWQTEEKKLVLDIGTGTGLLTLILAQKMSSSEFIALEIDENAIKKATENFKNSNWSPQITLKPNSLQTYQPIEQQFDNIICNPPFFHKHLNSHSLQRNIARHDEELSKEHIAEKVTKLLKQNGSFCILYPASEWEAWEKISLKYGLYPKEIIEIQPTIQKQANRIVGFYGLQKENNPKKRRLIIYEEEAPNYTEASKNLLIDYYLNIE